MDDLRIKTLQEINNHCHTHQLFTLDYQGQIKIYTCPFRVSLVVDETQIFVVESVKTNLDLLLLYQIKGELYPYYLYHLLK